MTDLPERITAMKSISYHVPEIVGYIADGLEKDPADVTLEDVLDWLEDDDIHGDIAGSNIIFIDENGSEL